jgi:hypothetical protein
MMMDDVRCLQEPQAISAPLQAAPKLEIRRSENEALGISLTAIENSTRENARAIGQGPTIAWIRRRD